MESLARAEALVLLLTAMLALTAVARKLDLPYPILLVVGGLGLGFVPGVPVLRLDPDLVFLVFLPPILWAAAYFTSLREFRANLRPITLLALGLVTATTLAVAAVAHALIPGLGWAPALVLGAIVSPPDVVAATAVMRDLAVPRRVITVLEGESLVNDASALVLYRAAVAAAVSGSFVLADTLIQLVLVSLGAVLIGLAVGWAATQVSRRTDDGFSEIAITLLAPYAAWVLAERAHTSAVLACVAGGFYLRQHFSAAVAPATRLQARAVWDQLIFLLNGLIFILIGLQLGTLRKGVAEGEIGQVLWYAAVISATAIVVRLVWVPIASYLPRLLVPAVRRRDPIPPAAPVFLVAWTGMRGIVSLAAALAIPLRTASGGPFPFRAEITLITFGVIFSTLVLQGLSLAPLIRMFKFRPDDALEQEERLAREHATTMALSRLDELAREPWAAPNTVERLRSHYAQRLRRFSILGGSDDHSAQQAAAYRRLRFQALSAERLALIALFDQGVISDEVLQRLEHELDVEALRIGIGELRPDQPALRPDQPTQIAPVAGSGS